MAILKLSSRFWYAIVLLSTALLLGGCFTSQTPLISAANAVYPFQTIAFYNIAEAEGGAEAETMTLTRRGDVYVDELKEDEGHYLFAKIDENLFIAQITEENGAGAPQLIYGIVQVQNDTELSVISPTCDDAPEDLLKTVGIVKTDEKYVSKCMVTSLDQLEALARLVIGTDIKREAYRITELVR